MTMDVQTGSIKRLRSLRITPWLRTRTKLVGSRGGDLQLLDVADKNKDPVVVWQGKVDGSLCDVLAPLGVLWFGNALSNSLVLPRHGEGPVEQVAGGRMFIEGPDTISATDVYTGRLLWTREFPGLGKYYVQTKHQRGAHAIGDNFFATADAVYVAAGKSCHLLDPSSGRTPREMRLPDGPHDDSGWLFLLVYEDLLIAGAQPAVRGTGSGEKILYNTPASSKKLVVMNRHDGKVLWTRTADRSFGHYAICAGSGKVFCIDRTSPETLNVIARRGQSPKGTPRIYTLEAKTGKVVWETGDGVGAQLTYSEEHDILLSGAALRSTGRRYSKTSTFSVNRVGSYGRL